MKWMPGKRVVASLTSNGSGTGSRCGERPTVGTTSLSHQTSVNFSSPLLLLLGGNNRCWWGWVFRRCHNDGFPIKALAQELRVFIWVENGLVL